MTVPIRPASTILLVRDSPRFEVLMVTRHHQIDFAANAMVFPGGKIDPQDSDHAWAGHADGWHDISADERALRIGAAREAFEESAIMLARRDGAAQPDWTAIAAARDDVAQQRVAFLDVVARHGLRLDLAGLTPFARWVTPAFMPKRFDTMFYIAAAPPDQTAVCDGWETVEAEWIAPAKALRLGAKGEREIVFPTRLNLQRLAESSAAAEAVRMAGTRAIIPVEPRIERRADGDYLTIETGSGYRETEERFRDPRIGES